MVNLQDSKHPDVLRHLPYCLNLSIFDVWLHADKTRALLPTPAASKHFQGKYFITLFIFVVSKLRLTSSFFSFPTILLSRCLIPVWLNEGKKR